MPAIAGFGGVITFPNLTAGVKTWLLNDVTDPLEKTELADDQDRGFIPGLKSFTGTMEANWDAANTVAVGDSGTGVFQVGNSGALTVTRTILITGIDDENAFDGVVSANVTFQGTGALTDMSSSSSAG